MVHSVCEPAPFLGPFSKLVLKYAEEDMARKRYSSEQIISMLREAEVLLNKKE
jgi:hypothetical protein